MISLAGLAFAVGMVLDAAIVVLENIVRLREKGQNARDASLNGASEVWGALFASTLTTVAIFIPVIFLKEIEGQLFSDLAITIAIAVVVSLIVAVTVLPVAAFKWLPEDLEDNIQGFRAKVVYFVDGLTNQKIKRRWLAGGLIAIPLIAAYLLFPEKDYLPPVKRDAVDTYFRTPAGASNQYIKKEYLEVITKRMQPYMDGDKEPALKNYYILTWPNGGTIGTRALDQDNVDALGEVIRDEITIDLPDFQAFSSQGNLFGGFGGDRAISLLIQHPDNKVMEQAVTTARNKLLEAIPGLNIRINPGLNQSEPELRFAPDDRAINEVGWNRQAVGNIIRTLGDGIYLGEYFDGEKRLDIILQGQPWSTPEAMAEVPLVTPAGAIRPLKELVDMQRAVGPSRISRFDQRRTISLNINPPEDMTLQYIIDTIEEHVEPQLRADLGAEGNISYSGSASDLDRAIKNIGSNFLLAIIILFLLMSALFKSARDSLLVVMSMPLAMVGGVFALQLLNLFTFQPMDLLTMIGFVILLGLVVNNAILLVYQSRELERHQGLSPR